MKQRLVVFHADCIDGFTSAWAAWRKFGDVDTEYMPARYGTPPPEVRGREVLVVDFAYPREVMLRMAREAASLRVLDHHHTWQAALDGLPFATFDMQRSGAGLTWDVLHGGKRPWLVDYVEDRDLWRFKLPNSKAVNAWIGALTRDSFSVWEGLLLVGAEASAERGYAVLAYLDRYVSEMVAQARLVEVAGHRVPMVNAPYISISELVGALSEGHPFAVGWFQRSDGQYVYSLRSRGPDGLDVSEIAKSFGGGGHRHAAGFTLRERLPEP
jgi:oligoribonuclease NrnB/cAMP/cGMP phosphodiesterase (DHH superfamily)